MYALCNNVKDLPVIFDGSDVVSVNRDNHYHNDVHLKKENMRSQIKHFKALTVQKTL